MKNLAVIPARGGSKGIRHKNMRLLNGKPLIFYSISNAVESGCFNDIVITTDDPEIIEYVSFAFPGVHIRKRPEDLGKDAVTLDPVIYDACVFMEECHNKDYDVVVTLQPTSPTLKAESIAQALKTLENQPIDSILSVTDATHLEWMEKDGKYSPHYEKRLNRQWLPRKCRETGAFFITRREFVTPESRLGKEISVYPLSSEESIDIDTTLDWIKAQAILERKKILIVVSGNETIGMGHIYRMITLTDNLLGNIIRFVLIDSSEQARQLLEDEGWDIREASLESVTDLADEFSPDIIINDILDTSREYMEHLTSRGFFMVNFEDLGEGTECAHLVINALYESSAPPPNHLFGSRYVCLNRRFLTSQVSDFREIPKKMIITFGGVDLNNLTLKTLKCLPKVFKKTPLEEVNVVLGSGYAHRKTFEKHFSELRKKIPGTVIVHDNVKNMATLMRSCDIAVTSNGRTVYELASMGLPALSIAQNDRKTLHLFARYNPGILYLGIACNVMQKSIEDELIRILSDTEQRRKMRENLLKANIRGGLERVKSGILQAHWRWKHENITYC